MATRPATIPSRQTAQPEAEEDLLGDLPETVVDEMAADSKKVEKPAGSPQLWPYAQLPRRMRANFFNTIRSFDRFQGKLDTKGQAIGSTADVMLFLADAEDALRIIAAHPPLFETWIETAEDQEVTDLLMWYLDRFQVGEAKGS